MAYNLTSITSAPPILSMELHAAPDSNSTSTATSPPCLSFMPFDTATDRLLRALYLQGITDEFGNLIKIPEMDLPSLDKEDIESLQRILNSTIHITDRSAQADIEIKIIDLLRDLGEKITTKHNTPLDNCELIGSSISLILGISYMKRAFSSLGLQNVDEFITPQLFKDLQRKVPDYDIRFNVSKAHKNKLALFTLEVIGAIASKKAFDENSYQEWCSYIQGSMLDKFKALSCPKTEYSIISTGDHVNTALEILFIKNLPRLHLFRRDALRLVLTPFLELEKKIIIKNDFPDARQKRTIIPQKQKPYVFHNVVPVSECCRGWQALIDLLTQTIYDTNVETMDIQAWPLLISHITRGGRCPNPNFVNAVFERMVVLAKPNKALGLQISDLIQTTLRNHHQSDPYAAICLAINSATLLPKKHISQVPVFLKEIIPWIKKGLLSVSNTHQNSSEKILESILHILEKHPNSLELISSLIQLHAFVQLSRPRSEECLGMPLINFRKHDGTPHIELKCGGSSILLPFNPNQAFDVVANATNQEKEPLPEDLIISLRVLGSLMITPLNPNATQSPIQSYQEHLGIDIPVLANKAVAYMECKTSLLSLLTFSLAAACELVTPGLKNINHGLIANFPKAMFEAQTKREKQALIGILELALGNYNGIIGKAILEKADETGQNLSTLQAAWIEDLAQSIHKNFRLQAYQLLQTYLLPTELHISACKSILPVLIKTDSTQALAVLTYLLEKSTPDEELCKQTNLYLESILKKINHPTIIGILPTLGSCCIELLQRQNATGYPLDSNFIENLDSLTEALIGNGNLSEAGQILKLVPKRETLAQSKLSKVWIAYCHAISNQKGPLVGLLAFENAVNLKIWNPKDLPTEAQQILVELTSKLYHLSASAPEPDEIKYFKQCIAYVKDPNSLPEIQSLSEKHVERLLEGSDKALILKEVSAVPSIYLKGDHLLSLKLKLIKIQIEQNKFSLASTSLKEILATTYPIESKGALKSLCLELLDKLLTEPQGDQQLAWNLNLAGQLLLNTLFSTLFANDTDYLFKLKVILKISCGKDSNINRNIIFELLEQFLELGFPKSPLPESITHFTDLHQFLSVICPPKYYLPENLKSHLIAKSENIIAALGENYTAESCISFFFVFHIHALKPTLKEEILRPAMSKIGDYLASSTCTRQNTLYASQFLSSYLNDDCIRQTLWTGLSIKLLSNLISALLYHSCPQQGIRWINVLMKLSIPFKSTWYDKVPQKILEWAPLLRKEKEHKKCLELLLQIKDNSPSIENAIVLELFNLIDSHLSRKDVATCGNLLIDHAPLFKTHVSENSLKDIANNVSTALLRDFNLSDRIEIALKLLSTYSFFPGQTWLTAMSHCRKSSSTALSLQCWKTFSHVVKATTFLEQEKSALAACWLIAVDLIQKSSQTDVIDLFEEYQNLEPLFETFVTPKQHIELLVKIFLIALDLSQSLSQNQFLVRKLHPLRRSLKKLLESPEAGDASFTIDLAIVKAFSQTRNILLYSVAFQTFRYLIATRINNTSFEALTSLFMGSVHFNEAANPGFEIFVKDLQETAFDLHDVYNPMPIIHTFVANPSTEIFNKAMDLILKHLETLANSNTTPCNPKNTPYSLMGFLLKITETNHPELMGKLAECLSNEKFKQYITESDCLLLRKKSIFKALSNGIEINKPMWLQFSCAYFFRDFKYIAHDEDASEECIDLFLQTVMMMLCNFVDLQQFKENLYRFNNMIQLKGSTEGKPNPFPLSPSRITRIQYTIIQAVLGQTTRNPYIADRLIKYAENGLRQLIEHNKKDKLLAHVLYEFVFSPLPSIGECYHEHIINAQHHIQQCLHTGMLNNHPNMLFEFDFYLNLFRDKKRPLPDPVIQIELVKIVFENVSNHHSPQSLWHLIDTLEKVHSLSAFDDQPEVVLDIYRRLIISMMPFMYYHVGGLPIYEHLFAKILVDPRLTGSKKPPEWQKVSLQIITLLVQRIDFLCLNPNERPAEITSIYEPVNYMFTLLMKSYFQGCFDGQHEEYISLINLILPLILTKMNADTLSKYSFLGLKLLMMQRKEDAPRTIQEQRNLANSIAGWIEMIAGSSKELPGALETAKALFAKCESEFFKDFPEAKQRATKALEKSL